MTSSYHNLALLHSVGHQICFRCQHFTEDQLAPCFTKIPCEKCSKRRAIPKPLVSHRAFAEGSPIMNSRYYKNIIHCMSEINSRQDTVTLNRHVTTMPKNHSMLFPFEVIKRDMIQIMLGLNKVVVKWVLSHYTYCSCCSHVRIHACERHADSSYNPMA